MSFMAITKLKWKPEPYQVEGVNWLSHKPASALFWPPGLGKTTTVLRAFQSLQKRKLAKRMLIIAPLKVCQGVWRQEIDKWEGFEDLEIGLAHGTDKADILMNDAYNIVLLNYDGIMWASGYLKHANFDVVCYDELTRLKHPNTRRFKVLKPLLQLFKFRWGLTGTPIPNGYMDLFGQVFCLDGGERLGKFITHYRFKYFHQLPWDQWTWYPNETAGRTLTRLISDLAHTVDEKKWLNIKKPIVVEIRVDLPTDAMKQYKALEALFITKIKEDVVTASNAAVLSGKLRQVASGSVYSEGRIVTQVHDAKLDALESLVEELNKDPVIIVVGFLHEVDAIRKRLGNIPYIGGGVSESIIVESLKRWNLGWMPVILVHPTSVSAGLNMQAGGRALIWYSMTWNREERDQMLHRIHRKGQTRQVFEYHIIANKTIDDYLIEVSIKKGATQDQFLAGLEKFFGI